MSKLLKYLLLLVFLITIFPALADGAMKASPNYIVLLVHGINGDEEHFTGLYGDFRGYLKNDLGLIDKNSSADIQEGYIYLDCFSEPKGSSKKSAEELGNRKDQYSWTERAFDEYKSKFSGSNAPVKVVIVAHSMGGLASRYYITQDFYYNDVKKLITLDTPHLGADGIAWYEKWEKDMGLSKAALSSGVDCVLNSLWAMAPDWVHNNGEDVYISSAHMTTLLNPTEPNSFLNIGVEDAPNYYLTLPHLDKTKLSGIEQYLGSLGFWLFIASQWEGEGLREMSPYSNFIHDLKNAEPVESNAIYYDELDPIEYRLVSARGVPTPHRKFIEQFYDSTPFLTGLMLKWLPEYNALPTEGQKAYAALLSIAVPGAWAVKDGSLLVGVDSSRGDGVKIFGRNTKRYDYLFKHDFLNSAAEFARATDAIIKGILFAQQVLQVPMPAIFMSAVALKWVPTTALTAAELESIGEVLYANVGSNYTNAYTYVSSHGWIIDRSTKNDGKGNSIIEYALYDDPQVSFSGLETDVSTEEYNATQTIVHTDIIKKVDVENFADANEIPPYSISQSVPINLTSTSERYLLNILVKVPVTQITGIMNDFKPLLLRSFQISENFGAWQDFQPNSHLPQKDLDNKLEYIEADAGKFHLTMDHWGRFTISGLDLAEGQNVIAFKCKNKVGYTSNQILKIIQNTIPMQPSQYYPKTGTATANTYQRMGVEFNKAGYTGTEDEAVEILSFELDGQPVDSDQLIVTSSEETYRMWAKAEYIPQESLEDGEHNVLVKAKSNVGVSQAIWSFHVDTQAPMVTLEAIAPYAPRAPAEEADPLYVYYQTSDNLSQYLKSFSFRLYQGNSTDENSFVTELTAIATQATGENFITWDGAGVPDGTYTIKVKVFDQAGNCAVATVPVEIDSTPPVIYEANVTPNPLTSNDNLLGFQGKLSEKALVTLKLIDRETEEMIAYVTQANAPNYQAIYNWSYDQFSAYAPQDGVYDLEITAQDIAGNVSAPVTVEAIRVDRTPPVLAQVHTMPYVLANSGENPYVTTLGYRLAEGDDKVVNRAESEIELKVKVKLYNENTGELIRTWDPAPSFLSQENEISWDGSSTSFTKGSYKFQIVAQDLVGNTSQAYATTVKDGIAPVVSYPAEGAEVGGIIALRGIAMDPDWTNPFTFKDYRLYWATGVREPPADLVNLDPNVWHSTFLEVPLVNRNPREVNLNTSIRPLQDDSTLAYLGAAGLTNGTYTILLVVDEESPGTAVGAVRTINIDNALATEDLPPYVRLGALPENIHFNLDGSNNLTVNFLNSIEEANVAVEICRQGTEEVVFYKYLPNVFGAKYIGRPDYLPGADLGYFIWQDAAGWHVRWSSDGGNHHFTGNLIAAGTISDVNEVGGAELLSSGPLISWDVNLNDGEQGFDFEGEFTQLIVTPKIDEDPENPQFAADDVYVGLSSWQPEYLPVMLDVGEAQFPRAAWDGKYSTCGFVPSGKYIVRVRAEGTDGSGLSTDEKLVDVTTDLALGNVEVSPVNKEFSPLSQPDRISIFYDLSKDAYVSAYVFNQNNGDLVSTITAEAFSLGRQHQLVWQGNSGAQILNSGRYYIKLLAKAEGEEKEAEIRDIVIDQPMGAGVATLDPLGEEEWVNGSLERVTQGKADYIWEAKGYGKYYPPRDFSFDLRAKGKQKVEAYPYFPYAILVHRGFDTVKVKVKTRLVGRYIDNSFQGFKGWTDDDGHSFVESGGSTNLVVHKGHPESYTRNIIYSADTDDLFGAAHGFQQPSKKFDRVGLEVIFYALDDESFELDRKMLNLDRGSYSFSLEVPYDIYIQKAEAMEEWANKEIAERVKTGGSSEQRKSEKGIFNVYLDDANPLIYKGLLWPRWPYNNRYGYGYSPYGNYYSMPKWQYDNNPAYYYVKVVPPNHYDKHNVTYSIRTELEEKVEYSRLTNRFVPWFGFTNKNHPVFHDFNIDMFDLRKLAFPGKEYFHNTKFTMDNIKLPSQDQLDRWASGEVDFKALVQDLYQVETNLSGGNVIDPITGFEHYLADEYLEIIPITTPDEGGVYPQPPQGQLDPSEVPLAYTVKTDYFMDINESPLVFNWPATGAEMQTIIDEQAIRLKRLRSDPASYNISNTAYEFDTDQVNTEALNISLSNSIHYDKECQKYYLETPTIAEILHENGSNLPENVQIEEFYVTDVSAQDIVPAIVDAQSVNSYIRFEVAGGDNLAQEWTTADDPNLFPLGLVASDPLLFNQGYFSPSGKTNPVKISSAYPLSASSDWGKRAFIYMSPPRDNPDLVITDWKMKLKDVTGEENKDLELVDLSLSEDDHYHADTFAAKLKLDASGNRYVEIKGSASSAYDLLYFDGKIWQAIAHSDVGKTGTLGWWNVNRLNGKYTVLLKLNDGTITTRDVLVGTVVPKDKKTTVAGTYKRAEVIFPPGAFLKDEIASVSPVGKDTLVLNNRPILETSGPIVELQPSPTIFPQDKRPTLTFKYTESDLKELYPSLSDTQSTEEVKGLGLNIHQVTAKGDLQIVQHSDQSYNTESGNYVYLFTAALDHFSDYVLLQGDQSLLAPSVLTADPIVNYTPITIYGSAAASSTLQIYIDNDPLFDEEDDNSPAEFLGTLPVDPKGNYQWQVGLNHNGENYIFVVCNAPGKTAKTVGGLKVIYDTTPPVASAVANLPVFSPNGDGKYDVADYTLRSSEKGRLYFVLRSPPGDVLCNQEFEIDKNDEVKIKLDGDNGGNLRMPAPAQVNFAVPKGNRDVQSQVSSSRALVEGQYTYTVFAIDEAGNISENIVDFTILDNTPPKISRLAALPSPFTPNADGIDDVTSISYELSESAYVTLKIYQEDGELFSEQGHEVLQSGGHEVLQSWDGRGVHQQLVGGEFTYYIQAEDPVGNIATSEIKTIVVDRDPFLIQYAYAEPDIFSPVNPANDHTNINYYLSRDNLSVSVSIWDGEGNVVNTLLLDEEQAKGRHRVAWDGSALGGSKVYNGTYKYEVKAYDPRGTDPEIGSGTLVVDNDAPVVTFGKVEIQSDVVAISYSLSEKAKVGIEVLTEDGSLFKTLVAEEIKPAGSYVVTYQQEEDLIAGTENVWRILLDQAPSGATGQAGGQEKISFRLTAVDEALNSAQFTSELIALGEPLTPIIISAVAVPTLFSPYGDGHNDFVRIGYDLSGGEGDLKVTVKILDAALATVKTLVNDEGQFRGGHSVDWYGTKEDENLAFDGIYSYVIEVLDSFGQKEEARGQIILVAAPNAEIAVDPAIFSPNANNIQDTANIIYDVSFSENLSGEGLITLDIFDQGDTKVYSFIKAQARGSYTHVWDGRDTLGEIVPDGIYTIKFKIQDPAGTVIYPNNIYVAVDTVSPLAPVIDQPKTPTNQQIIAVSGQAEGGAEVSLRNGQISGEAITDSSGTWDISEVSLAQGLNTLEAVATDPSGNTSSLSDKVTVVYDPVSPLISSVNSGSDNPNDSKLARSGNAAAITFAVSKALADDPLVTVNGNDAVFSDLQSLNYAYAYLVMPGDETGQAAITISGIDPAGNTVEYSTSSLTESFRIDTTAPITGIAGAIASPNPFTPNNDGNQDATTFFYSTDEDAYLTLKVYTYDDAKAYSSSNLVKTVFTNLWRDAANYQAIWDGTVDVPGGWGDANSNGYADAGKYTFIVEAKDLAGNVAARMGGTVYIQDIPLTLASGSQVAEPQPNPYSPSVGQLAVSYQLHTEALGEVGTPEVIGPFSILSFRPKGRVTVVVKDTNGDLVKTLISAQDIPEFTDRSTYWDGKNISGQVVPDGIYTIVITAEDLTGAAATNQLSYPVVLDNTKPTISNVSLDNSYFSPHTDYSSVNATTLSYQVADNLDQLTGDFANEVEIKVKVFRESNLVKTLTQGVADVTWAGSTDGGNYVGEAHGGGAYPDGNYTYKIVATDVAGNSEEFSGTVMVDTLQPEGSITLNDDDAYANNPSVTLNLSATDLTAGGIVMRFKNEAGSWEAAEDFADTKLWNLSHGDGVKTVYVRYQDRAGNYKDFSDEIILDALPPSGSITINDADPPHTISRQVKLNLSATDLNDVSEMRISNDNSSWLYYSYGTVVDDWELASVDGEKTVYVRYKDNADNWSNSFTDTIILDPTPPSGSISINGGNSYTNSTSITLDLSASDGGTGLAQMRFKNDGGDWTAWESYQSAKSWNLSAGDGTKRVYVQYNDVAGNLSSQYSDTIVLDTAPPNGNVTSVGPNPFNQMYDFTTITYDLSDNLAAEVGIKAGIYAADGAHIVTLHEYPADLAVGSRPPDNLIPVGAGRIFAWDGTNNWVEGLGDYVNEGNYEIRIMAKDPAGNESTLETAAITAKDDVLLSSREVNSVNPVINFDGDALTLNWIENSQDYSRSARAFRRGDTWDGWFNLGWRDRSAYFYIDHPQQIYVECGADDYVTTKHYVYDPDGVKIFSTGSRDGDGYCDASKVGTYRVRVKMQTSWNNAAWTKAYYTDRKYYKRSATSFDYGKTWDISSDLAESDDNSTGPVTATSDEIIVHKVSGNFPPPEGTFTIMILSPLVYQRSYDGGDTWSDAVQIAGTSNHNPTITVDPDNNAYVAWEDNRDGDYEIYFQKIPVNFAPVNGTSTGTLSLSAFQPTITPQSSNKPVIKSPADGATIQTLRPQFEWEGVQYVTDYRIEIDSDQNFISPRVFLKNITSAESLASAPQVVYAIHEFDEGLAQGDWCWRVASLDGSGNVLQWSDIALFTIEPSLMISGVTNYPNPFNPNRESTKIRYRLSKDADVTINIYDLAGYLVKQMTFSSGFDGGRAEGASIWDKYNDVVWDGKNGNGDFVLNGVYPFEVIANDGATTAKGRGKIAILK